jgi:hypothetical protein
MPITSSIVLSFAWWLKLLLVMEPLDVKAMQAHVTTTVLLIDEFSLGILAHDALGVVVEMARETCSATRGVKVEIEVGLKGLPSV